ncbi:MAG: DNA polymerase III subunit alpha [Halothiobacillaceae bacterium]|nr:DNA polymerase III subunit alpha [Halothiobacillaceae bacterium]
MSLSPGGKSAPGQTPPFVHLHLHTEFSLVDSLVRIKPLMKAVAAAGMPAVALTDQGNLFALVKFYKAAREAGIKPIIGADVLVRGLSDQEPPSRLVLLCQDNTGYRHLTELLSEGYTRGQHDGVPMLERAWLSPAACEGLIALSGGREGDIARALLGGREAEAERVLAFWNERFPARFYLELSRCGRPAEETLLHAQVALAGKHGLPVVATNDVRFLAPSDFEAHEVRVCIHEGRVLDDPRRPRVYSDQQYLRSPEEMALLFSDIPEALENTLEIARRCNVTLTLGKNFLPQFPIPEGMTEDEYFRKLSREGLEARLTRLVDPNRPDAEEMRARYRERLEIELDVILQMGFPGYFLIVADFIQWAKDNGIPVGPGRGSGAGSLVAYALLITDIDPLPYDLLFERFLNPERVSMPDFDIDFCMEGRDRVIEYVATRYGRESVSQIATHGTMAAKAVVRDVGRVLGQPYGFVDRISKLIPAKPGLDVTLDDALGRTERSQKEPERYSEDFKKLYESDEEVQSIVDMGRALEGLTRNVGKHAGGVVIAPSKLTDFTPLYCEENGSGLVSQLDKDDVEAIGLVKFDFLGLRTLTIIDWAVKTINVERQRLGEPLLDISDIDLADPASYRLLKNCETTAVFQLESRGMKDLIRRLQPDCFEDIIALVALFRPGPLQSGMVDDFINRKHGRAAVEYLHPALTEVLTPTYGVIVYQEQVMQIAQILAGYTLGGADLLRRAMGKKKPEEMAKQREIFMEGASSQNVDPEQAGMIFDLMEKFAGYGFNKSHSAAYALLSFQTAWLKAHYPAAFMAAVLSADMDNTDKVVVLIDECRRMGLRVVPPGVNDCAYKFTIKDPRTVVYGLGAIKGVGQGPVDAIIAEREKAGRFSDLNDFCRRVGYVNLNKRVLEAMIRAGALDELGPNRASLMSHMPEAMRLAEQAQQSANTGMGDLFGLFEVDREPSQDLPIPTLEDWPDAERLQYEKDTLGLYLTGHPIDAHREELDRIVSDRIGVVAGQLEDSPVEGPRRDRETLLAGLLVSSRIRRLQNGDKEAFLTLDDGSGRLEVRLFPEEFRQYAELLVPNAVLIAEGGASLDPFSGGVRLRCKRLLSLEQARAAFTREIRLRLSRNLQMTDLDALIDLLQRYRDAQNGGKTLVEYRSSTARAVLRLPPDWSLIPADELLRRLGEHPAVQSFELVYGRRMEIPITSVD